MAIISISELWLGGVYDGLVDGLGGLLLGEEAGVRKPRGQLVAEGGEGVLAALAELAGRERVVQGGQCLEMGDHVSEWQGWSNPVLGSKNPRDPRDYPGDLW